MEGKNEQARNSQGCHFGSGWRFHAISGDDGLVAATDREVVTYGLPRRHPIVDMEMVRYGDGGESQRDDHANDQQNGDFRSTLHAEGSRSNIASWKLSSREG